MRLSCFCFFVLSLRLLNRTVKQLVFVFAEAHVDILSEHHFFFTPFFLRRRAHIEEEEVTVVVAGGVDGGVPLTFLSWRITVNALLLTLTLRLSEGHCPELSAPATR